MKRTGRFVIVGSGRAGSALAARLRQRKEPVVLAGRRPRTGVRAVRDLRIDPADVVVLAVPDRAIRANAVSLVSHGARILLHVSGSRPVDDLPAEAVVRGILHPPIPFPPPGEPVDWTGVVVGLDGDRRGLAAGRRLARALGTATFQLPEDRSAYHLALSLSAAGVVTLLDSAIRRLRESGLPEGEARHVATRLAAAAVRSTASLGAGRALTGSIARGDSSALSAHLGSANGIPFAPALFAATIDLASRERRIPERTAKTLQSVLLRTAKSRPAKSLPR